MPSLCGRSAFTGGAAAAVALVLLGCPGGAEGQADAIPVTKEVQVAVEGGKIARVTPRNALVKPGSRLVLVASGLGDNTLEIDFNVERGAKGPFQQVKGTPRGRFTLSSANGKFEGVVDAPVDTSWKYEIVLRDKDGVDRDAIDPMIIIQQ